MRVVLLDIDNTLLDNDAVTEDLRRHLREAFGEECQRRYWDLFEELRRHFDDDSLIELTMIVAWENSSSKFNHALRVPSQHLWRRRDGERG